MSATFARNIKWIGAAGLVLAAALLVFNFSAPRLAGAQAAGGNMENTISVSGSGEAMGTPDIAYISLGVDYTDAVAGTAIEQANTRMRAIIEALKGAGLAEADIQTASYNVFPQYNYDQNGNPTGAPTFRVQNTLNVTVRDISQAGALIDVALQAGANTVNSLSYGFSDSKALESQARQEAVEDARSRAQELATLFGVQLGDVVMVTESIYLPAPIPMGGGFNRMDIAQAGGVAPQVTPGQMSVSVSINVSFAIAR
jgi:uncharacterized protein YggE